MNHQKPQSYPCSHRRYLLTCAEYDELRARAQDRCEICRRNAVLFVDHDWDLGWWAARGLLCRSCNAKHAVDGMAATTDERIHAYLANPWWRRHGVSPEVAEEPERGGKVRIAPHGWIFQRGSDRWWYNTSASYRRNLTDWRQLNRDYGPFNITILGPEE